MKTTFTVLSDHMLFRYIVEFQCGLPYALLQLESDVYASETRSAKFRPQNPVGGASLLHHALLADNVRMVALLFRMHGQPYYAAMGRLALDRVLELVCKRGSVGQLERFREKPGVPALWPSNLLRITVDAFENPPWKDCSDDKAILRADQKNKAEWLMTHHPEACTDVVKPCGILISALELRNILLKLLATDTVDLGAFAGPVSRCLDVSLLELLVRKYPRAITPDPVTQCASHGNIDALKFLHDHENELPDGRFTPRAMDAAANGGHLEVVRFLHEHRTERCTALAIDWAAQEDHMEVVKFLHETRNEPISQWAFKMSTTVDTAATATATWRWPSI